MLIVDPDKRFTVDQCLAHPWMTAGVPGVNDSTDGLVGGIASLDVARRGPPRERTLLSSLNSVEVTRLPVGGQPVKIFAKNPKSGKTNAASAQNQRELRPADGRDPAEFVGMGGRGDQELFGNDANTFYSTRDVAAGKDTANGR